MRPFFRALAMSSCGQRSRWAEEWLRQWGCVMSASVIDLDSVRARLGRAKPRPSVLVRAAALGDVTHDFTFWRGATGMKYVHTVYGLLDCPELPPCNVMLVRRSAGHAHVVSIGRVEDEAPSINLAEIRRSAALLGANEVHVHLLGQTHQERAAIEHDLAGAGELLSSSATH